MKKTIAIALFSLLLHSLAYGQLTSEQQEAKEKGLELYQQSDWYDSQSLLKVAAEGGDSTAQYYLAEVIRLSNRYKTAEAEKWYEAAAEQGDLYAMLRLSSKDDLCNEMGSCAGKSGKDWREQALKVAREQAENGDSDAMTVLYTANQGLDWLEKAANAGNGFAQKILAGVYQDGGGWFLIPGSREKAVERWFRASAEGGYAPGMYLYANFLYEKNASKEEIGKLVKKSRRSRPYRRRRRVRPHCSSSSRQLRFSAGFGQSIWNHLSYFQAPRWRCCPRRR
ncbi:tetratricopeptide repeat protein [Pseudomonas iridis]|uniref:tetratricopeptide repeat protein n=1 Tax=Pseudomonas iridis TaxID=2710587 RepID=UPI0037C67959